jgi:4-hydroxy 2-oxovalerate aldolase
MNKPVLLDCTLRDGGYYNAWDFPSHLIESYLQAMKAVGVDVVELGFRFLKNSGFKGACAFTTDEFLKTLPIPDGLSVSVMVNGADLCTEIGWEKAVVKLFPSTAADTPVDMVRIACHFEELPNAVAAANWLSKKGYRVGLNLMQIADRSKEEIDSLTKLASGVPIEVLYFADSMGSMTPDSTAKTIDWLREGWSGPIGIHTHDNMGMALANTLRAAKEGAQWLDSTVTGMGRGPGNAKTEELVIELADTRGKPPNLVPLMTLIRQYFGPMKNKCGWGTNPYYYLAGKYGIHPTYIQEMLGDARYNEEDIFAVIDHLRAQGGKKFSFNNLDGARQFYQGEPRGTWSPATLISGREVLILGTGPGVAAHRAAVEEYIRKARPIVLALNIQASIDQSLIDLRVACHPVRLLADAKAHLELPQPLIAPFSMLPETLKAELSGKEIFDFGLGISPRKFEFHEAHCIVPSALVLAYALAVSKSGRGKRILLAGFDGYPAGDLRNAEVESVLVAFAAPESATPVLSITPTVYKNLSVQSIYAI